MVYGIAVLNRSWASRSTAAACSSRRACDDSASGARPRSRIAFGSVRVGGRLDGFRLGFGLGLRLGVGVGFGLLGLGTDLGVRVRDRLQLGVRHPCKAQQPRRRGGGRRGDLAARCCCQERLATCRRVGVGDQVPG